MAFDPKSNPIIDALRFAQGSPDNAGLDFSKAFAGMENVGPFQSYEQAVDYGMKPVNGMVYKGNVMPGAGPNSAGALAPPDPNAPAPTGQWQYIGDYDTGNRNPDHGSSIQKQWRYQENQPQAAPAQRQVEEEPPPQAAPTGGKTIYNDWDTYQNKARADVEGMNRMPFVYSDYAGVSLDPQKAMQQFYPAAWQEGGVQKTIGPNGQNIAPYLNSDFGDPQFLDTTKKDMPSLVQMLLDKGGIDQRQSQALLDLMKPKKLDTSFAMTGMGR